MAFDPTLALEQTFTAHGVETVRTDQGISIPGSGIVFSAEVVRVWNHPASAVVQLDVRVACPLLRGKLLIESFGASGADQAEAAALAFSRFLEASFHTLVAALVDPKFGDDQVEWESWSFEGNTWRICMGPAIFQGEAPTDFPYGELLDRLKDELLPTLDDGPHWLRTFFWKNGPDVTTIEALLDNKDWPEGRRIVAASNWPEGVYSARQFLFMQA